MNFVKSKKYKIFSVAAVIITAGIIFMFSAQTSVDSAQTSGFIATFLSELIGKELPNELVRSFAHFCEYALFGFLVRNCAYTFKNDFGILKTVSLAWAYSWSDEIHQIFVDGRAFQLSDLAVDLGGIVLGTYTFVLIVTVIKKCRKQHECA